MKFGRRLFDRARPAFEEGGKLRVLHPLFEAIDTLFYSPDAVTATAPHVRDSMDLKRMMGMVVLALMPCVFMAMWNTGYQANLALQTLGVDHVDGWRNVIFEGLGFSYDSSSFLANLLHGSLYFLPAYIVTMTVGGLWEVLFSCVRKHEVAEGFFVTGLLFPLILPPAMPLWQVAVGISFGVVIGKEVFGGTGRNFLNPALAGRAFLFFAYPAAISGDTVWTAVDGVTKATPLAAARTAEVFAVVKGMGVSWWDAFLGVIPGSMGETSALACLIGAAILLATGIGSWRIMAAMLFGTVVTIVGLQAVGPESDPMYHIPLHWHLVTGGFAFGLVFMATDPVSAANTNTGQWIFGILIGVLCVVIRVVNPAYPEGVMLAILLGNVFAPLIDYCVIEANIKRRMARNGA